MNGPKGEIPASVKPRVRSDLDFLCFCLLLVHEFFQVPYLNKHVAFLGISSNGERFLIVWLVPDLGEERLD